MDGHSDYAHMLVFAATCIFLNEEWL